MLRYQIIFCCGDDDDGKIKLRLGSARGGRRGEKTFFAFLFLCSLEESTKLYRPDHVIVMQRKLVEISQILAGRAESRHNGEAKGLEGAATSRQVPASTSSRSIKRFVFVQLAHFLPGQSRRGSDNGKIWFPPQVFPLFPIIFTQNLWLFSHCRSPRTQNRTLINYFSYSRSRAKVSNSTQFFSNRSEWKPFEG